MIERKGKAILASHLGRPKGKRADKYSLKPVASRLSELLGREVKFADDCIGPDAEGAVAAMKEGDVLLLENLRFHAEEEKNDKDFSQSLARLADIYVDDAFAVAHRGHASNSGITAFVKTCAVGLLLQSQLDYLKKATETPARPLVAIIGGAKVSDKMESSTGSWKRWISCSSGAAWPSPFSRPSGAKSGSRSVRRTCSTRPGRSMEKAKAQGRGASYLPVDCVVAQSASADAAAMHVPVQEIPKEWMALDIGPASTILFGEAVADAKTIVWNGPMGMFELDPFSKGTYGLVSSVASSHALTIVGGGDTDTAVHKAGEAHRISYISTGGGAFLELLEGKTMPAVEALETCGG